MDASNITLYKPSLITVLLKKTMAIVQRVLPKSLYDTVYEFGFAVYRAMLRVLYSRHVLYSWLNRNDERIRKAVSVFQVMPYSLVGTSGLEATYDAVVDVERRHVEGAIVECGVAQGGSAALMALASRGYDIPRKFWLFDSFEGLPEPSDQDYLNGKTGVHVRELPKGSCLGRQEEVERLLFDDLGFDRGHFTLVKGWFEDTVEPSAEQIGRIAILRIDADWYESVRCCLNSLYDNVVPSGYVIIDDYGTCFGARRALDEFLQERSIKVELKHDGRGGCLFVKPG